MIKWKREAMKTVRSNVPTIYDYFSEEAGLRIFHNKFGAKKDRWILETWKGNELGRFETLTVAKVYAETYIKVDVALSSM